MGFNSVFLKFRILGLFWLLGFFYISDSYCKVAWVPLPEEAYQFGKKYPQAQHLLFAFDYGHALVYERLLLNKGDIGNPEVFEKEILNQIMVILSHPPSIKVDEEDIAPQYVFQFSLVVDLFDWSHLLHQFIYDVLATTTDRGEGMLQRIHILFEKYKSSRRVAITDVCKTMLFMDGHYFSKSFRRTFPSFNLLIWSYHWLQIRLYEDLMLPSESLRDQAVDFTVQEFKRLVSQLPESAPFDMMPETALVAPVFSRNFPKIAAAFDNNHMLHDIVSDILTSKKVDRTKVRFEGMRVGRMALDPDAYAAQLCAQ